MSSDCVKRRGSVTTWMNSANTCGAIAMTSPAESTCVSFARASVLGVLSYLRGHKEPGVEAMDHGRPSSISPSRSSSEVSGRSTEPRPTVAMSRTLCDREPSIRGAGDTVPCASTVTSCPSGKRTPLSSTTTPFCTRPWETMGNLVQSRVTDADSSDFITRGIREKSVLRQSKWDCAKWWNCRGVGVMQHVKSEQRLTYFTGHTRIALAGRADWQSLHGIFTNSPCYSDRRGTDSLRTPFRGHFDCLLVPWLAGPRWLCLADAGSISGCESNIGSG